MISLVSGRIGFGASWQSSIGRRLEELDALLVASLSFLGLAGSSPSRLLPRQPAGNGRGR